METLSPTARRRILKLVEFMEKLPRKAADHFNMGVWFKHYGDHNHFAPHQVISAKDMLHACGTTACAVGWAGTMPYFQKRGIKTTGAGLMVEGSHDKSHAALARIFDVTLGDALDLFASINEDPTPKAWAKRVRKTFGLGKRKTKKVAK